MAVLPVLIFPDERLKQIAQPVERFDTALSDFIHDLEQTMRVGPGGVGIAGPQVGCLQRIVIVDVSSRPKIAHHGRLILINPEIVHSDGSVTGREGCMSVPDFTGNVQRAQNIKLRSRDEHGAALELECSGYEARAILHEMDHLDGLLFLDRLVGRRSDLFPRKKYL